MLSASGDVAELSSYSALERALRPQRIVLGVAALAIMLLGSNNGVSPLGSDVRGLVGLIAIVDIVWNLIGLHRNESVAETRRVSIVQVVIDVVLALASIIALDSQATPLAWILLFVPVLDAAVRFGLKGAVTVWAALSLVYVAILLAIGGDGDVGSLRTGIQQVVALLAVVVPTLIVTGRLRGDLDATGEARAQADDHVYRMRAVSSVAQQLSSAADPEQVLSLAADCVLRLGFARADLCTKQVGGDWVLRHASGCPGGFDPESDLLLQRAELHSSKASAGVGETSPEDKQALHDSGYEAAMVVVVQTSAEQSIGIRAYSEFAISSSDPIWESLETLVALIGAAWTNRSDHLALASVARQMQYEASHDSLTGLPNRIQLLRTLDEAMDRQLSDLALYFLDLNGFKEINDSFGHEAGDVALRRIAERLGSLVKGAGLTARIGGDEFVVVVFKRDNAGLERLANDIISTVTTPIDVGQGIMSVGTSVGLAVWDRAEDSAALIRRADQAMYVAKQQGRYSKTSGYRKWQPEVVKALEQ